MLASDPITVGLTNGRADAARALDAAQHHLVMLRNLQTEMWDTYRTLVPPGTGAWRSQAADRYAERLDELRRHLLTARDAVDWAEAALMESVARLQSEHDALVARVG